MDSIGSLMAGQMAAIEASAERNRALAAERKAMRGARPDYRRWDHSAEAGALWLSERYLECLGCGRRAKVDGEMPRLERSVCSGCGARGQVKYVVREGRAACSTG